MDNLITSPKMLRTLSNRKRNPEFEEAVREVKLAHMYADKMLAEGRLTQKEADHFEAHLYGKLLEALPVDDFHRMMEDGSLEDLRALAGYEGDHDAGDIEDIRNEIYRKVQADALDEAWIEGRVDSKYYAEGNREIERYHDEKTDNRLADGVKVST